MGRNYLKSRIDKLKIVAYISIYWVTKNITFSLVYLEKRLD